MHIARHSLQVTNHRSMILEETSQFSVAYHIAVLSRDSGPKKRIIAQSLCPCCSVIEWLRQNPHLFLHWGNCCVQSLRFVINQRLGQLCPDSADKHIANAAGCSVARLWPIRWLIGTFNALKRKYVLLRSRCCAEQCTKAIQCALELFLIRRLRREAMIQWKRGSYNPGHFLFPLSLTVSISNRYPMILLKTCLVDAVYISGTSSWLSWVEKSVFPG